MEEGGAVIGRSVDCDVVCNDRAVSREHAVITCMKGEYYLDDNKSLNGTYVNNELLTTRRLLRNEDRIQIGATVMTFIASPHEMVAGERTAALFGEASNERVRSIDVLKARFSLEDVVELRGQWRNATCD